MGELWHRLSSKYTGGATRQVTATLNEGTTGASVFRTTEWPIIEKAIKAGHLGGMTVYIYKFDETGSHEELIGEYYVRSDEELNALPPADFSKSPMKEHQQATDEAQNAKFEQNSKRREQQLNELYTRLKELEGDRKTGSLRLRWMKTPTNTPASTRAGSTGTRRSSTSS
jgi:hypothetical protein